MKRLTAIRLLLFAGFLAPVFSFGQGTSAITATITDPDSQTWNNGTYSITLVPAPGSTQSPVWVRTPTSPGVPFQQSYSGTLNSSGAFSITIPDTNFISPAGAQWNFNLCSNTSASCQSVTTAVTGVSPNLSSTLSNALTAPRFNSGQTAFGYLDVEVNTPANAGAIYYNVTAGTLKCWSGSGWAGCGEGGGGPPSGSAGGDLSGTYPNPSVAALKSVPFCAGFTPTTGQFVEYTTGGSPSPCYSAATASGSFTPGGDLSGTSSSQQVVGIHSVPLCTGFTPTAGQSLVYSTSLSPNPCYTAATASVTPASIAGAIICVDTSGSANSITCSTTPSLSSLPNPGYFLITPANTNTGATTITVSSAAAVSVVYNAANATALTGGELVQGVQTLGYYDGTHMRIYKGYDLDVASFPGANAGAKYAAALASVPTSNVFVTLNGTNLAGASQTINSNFLPVGTLTCPVAGKVIWPAADIAVNAPLVDSCFTLEGKGNSHTGSLTSGTALEAGASLVPAFAGTGNIAASTGGTGSSYQFVVTGTGFASQVGDVFSVCSASLGQTGTACLGTAATTQARGTVIAASSTSLTVQSSAAVTAASGVNFVTFPCVLCMGDNSGQSSGVPAESGIEAYKFDIDCQVNSIAGCIPLFVSSAQNLSKAHDLTLKPYNDAGFELMSPGSQQFSLHDIWVASGTNTTAQAYCGVSRVGSSNIPDIRYLSCFSTVGTIGLIIDDGTRWGGQLHMVGAYTSAIEAGFAPTLPYVSFNGPSSSIAGMVIEDVDLNGSGSPLVNGVSVASGQSNYKISRVFKSSGTVTNLINDSTTGCTDPTSGEKYLMEYGVNSNGQIAVSYSPAATCQPQIGVGINTQTGTTYTYSATTDLASLTNFSNASAVAVTLPESNTLPLNWFNKSCNLGAGTVTITPTVSTITYTTGSSVVSAASSVAITTGQCIYLYANNASSGNTFLGNVALSGSGAVSSVSNSDSSLTISPTVGAVVASLNTGHANTFTANQTLTGHLIMSGHDVAIPLVCSDTSGSGTAQSCTTSPSFTPAAGDSIIYTTTTSNSGTGLTINVNSLGAKSVAKWQNTTTLAANDLRSGTYVQMTYDGTNWEIVSIGNAPSGGGSGLCHYDPIAGSSDQISAAGTFATTASVAATCIGTGSLIAIRAHGVFTTTTTASPQFALEVNAGGTTGICPATVAITLGVSITNGYWDVNCFIQINGSNTAVAWGQMNQATSSGGSATSRMFSNNSTGTVSYTTTGSQTVSVAETATMVSGQTVNLTALDVIVTQ